MKQKIVVIMLSVLLIVSVAYGVIATVAARSFSNENQTLSDEYKQLSEKHSDTLLEGLSDEPPVVLSAVGTSINAKATTHKINDDAVLIVVPNSDDVVDKVKEYASTIPIVLKTAEYKTCVIMVVNANNDCICGWTIHDDGTSKVFVGE